MDKKAMYKLSYGLFVLTAQENGKDNGCIINTVTQVTSDPNQITIAVNKANLTHDMILRTNKFNVSVISQEADFALFQRFGFQSGRTADKFAGFEDAIERTGNELYAVKKGTNAVLSAWVTSTIDLGTHTLFIATVTDMSVLSDAPSCTYEYYQTSIKPKPQKPAAPAGKVTWVCQICGYVYEGDPIPSDFICPICKHGAVDFERVVS